MMVGGGGVADLKKHFHFQQTNSSFHTETVFHYKWVLFIAHRVSELF